MRSFSRLLVASLLVILLGGCQSLLDAALGKVEVKGRVGTPKGDPVAGATVSVYAVSDLVLTSAMRGTCRVRADAYDAGRPRSGCPIVLIGETEDDASYRLQPSEFPAALEEAQTDATGNFLLNGVSRNGYVLLARKREHALGVAGMDTRTGQITEQSAVVPATAEADLVEVNLVMAGGTVPGEGRSDDAADGEDVPLPPPGPRTNECAQDADCVALLGEAPAGTVWLCEPGTDGVRICTGVARTEEGCTSDADCDDADASTSDFCLEDATCGHCTASQPDDDELPPVTTTTWRGFAAFDTDETLLADATDADVQLRASAASERTRVLLVRGRLEGATGRAFLRIQTGASSCSEQEATTELLPVELDADGRVVSEKGDYQAIPLTGGYQVLQLASTDTADALVSHRITIGTRCALPGNELKVIMSWDTDGDDVDLHVWNGAGEETAWTSLTSSYGAQDLDDVWGFGPEVFTSNEGHTGDSYSVRVHYFRGGERPNVTLRVLQTDGTCLVDETFVVTLTESWQWIDVGNFTPSRACAGR